MPLDKSRSELPIGAGLPAGVELGRPTGLRGEQGAMLRVVLHGVLHLDHAAIDPRAWHCLHGTLLVVSHRERASASLRQARFFFELALCPLMRGRATRL